VISKLMEDDISSVRAYAMRLLGFRSQSVAEMQRKMQRRKFSPQAIQEVIQELRRQGYLNDPRFAAEFVRSTIRRKEVGEFYLRQKLFERGIPDKIITDTLLKEYSLEKRRELAMQAAKRKAEEFRVKLQRLSTKQRSQIASFLSSRGFSGDIIQDTLEMM